VARKTEVLVTGHTHDHAARDAIIKAERLASALEDVLNGGDEVTVLTTRRERARYEMHHWEPGMDEATTSHIFIVISPVFVQCLPDYDLTPLAQNVMLKLIGKLGEKDDKGNYQYFSTDGEIRITQKVIANTLRVARPSAGRALSALTQRGFIWSTGLGKIQIHPRIAYFGPAEVQAEAIIRITSKRPDKRLPRIMPPGAATILERKNKQPVLVLA
jgi:hypothetical protein